MPKATPRVAEARDLGEGHAAVGQPAHVDGAVGDVEVRRPRPRGDARPRRGSCRAAAPPASRIGGPGIGGDAAGEAADAIGDGAGVAGHHVDVLVADADRIGGDLGEGGLVALSLWRRAAGHDDAPAGIEPQDGALEGPEADALDADRHADAPIAALGAEPRLLAARSG